MNMVGKNIRKLRTEKGLTQEQLAQQLHVTRQAVSNYETGKSNPDITLLIRIAEIFEVDVNTLIYGISQKPDKIDRKAWLQRGILLALLYFVLLIVRKQILHLELYRGLILPFMAIITCWFIVYTIVTIFPAQNHIRKKLPILAAFAMGIVLIHFCFYNKPRIQTLEYEETACLFYGEGLQEQLFIPIVIRGEKAQYWFHECPDYINMDVWINRYGIFKNAYNQDFSLYAGTVGWNFFYGNAEYSDPVTGKYAALEITNACSRDGAKGIILLNADTLPKGLLNASVSGDIVLVYPAGSAEEGQFFLDELKKKKELEPILADIEALQQLPEHIAADYTALPVTDPYKKLQDAIALKDTGELFIPMEEEMQQEVFMVEKLPAGITASDVIAYKESYIFSAASILEPGGAAPAYKDIYIYNTENGQTELLVPYENMDYYLADMLVSEDVLYWLESDYDSNSHWIIKAMHLQTKELYEIDRGTSFTKARFGPQLSAFGGKIIYISETETAGSIQYKVNSCNLFESAVVSSYETEYNSYGYLHYRMQPYFDEQLTAFQAYYLDGWYLAVEDYDRTQISEVKLPLLLPETEIPLKCYAAEDQIIYYSSLGVTYVLYPSTGSYKILSQSAGYDAVLYGREYLYLDQDSIQCYDLDSGKISCYYTYGSTSYANLTLVDHAVHIRIFDRDTEDAYYIVYTHENDS